MASIRSNRADRGHRGAAWRQCQNTSTGTGNKGQTLYPGLTRRAVLLRRARRTADLVGDPAAAVAAQCHAECGNLRACGHPGAPPDAPMRELAGRLTCATQDRWRCGAAAGMPRL